MDSDQELFQDHNDDLIAIVPVNDSDGTFQITFDSGSFKDGWLEGSPDLYLIIRDGLDGTIICKTEVRRGVKIGSPELNFDIVLNVEGMAPSPLSPSSLFSSATSLSSSCGCYSPHSSSSHIADPYSENNNRVLAAFSQLGDVAQLTLADINRNFALLISSINAWTLYTQENMWKKIRYDGPQVPRYPWREKDHKHTLSWEQDK
jgi:hypothetical protein